MKRAYMIFDSGTTSLLAEYPVYTGNNSADAVRKYMSDNGINAEIKVSSDRDVRFGALPAVVEYGKVLHDGSRRTVWYKAYRKEAT